MIIEKIKQEFPKSYKYFMDFYENQYPHKIEGIDFQNLAFEYQLGVFILFFDTVNSDIQLYATQSQLLKQNVLEAFATYEEYHFLDS